MSELRWNQLSDQLLRAASKANARFIETLPEQASNDWPSWVPTTECVTLNDSQGVTVTTSA